MVELFNYEQVTVFRQFHLKSFRCYDYSHAGMSRVPLQSNITDSAAICTSPSNVFAWDQNSSISTDYFAFPSFCLLFYPQNLAFYLQTTRKTGE
jgi:hypothetical protein